METSRIVRRQEYKRKQSVRFFKMLPRVVVISLLLLCWYLDKSTLFVYALINVVLGLVLFNTFNIRNYIPGLNSPVKFKRGLAVMFYMIAVLVIISCVSQ